MTFKERLMAVFEGRKPDSIPWFADLGYWYHAMEEKGELPEKYKGNGIVQLYKDLGAGAWESVIGAPYVITTHDVETKVDYEKDRNGKPVKERIEWKTPVGTLSQVKEYIQQAYTWAYREYPVKNMEGLKILQFIYEHREVKRGDFEAQKRRIELFGEWGVASSAPPRNPMVSLFVEWMGVVNTSYALMDMPEEIEKTLDIISRIYEPIFEAICDSPAPLVCFADNITGEVVSPKIFEKYYAPYYRKYTSKLRKAGKYSLVHIDGTMRALLPLVSRTGIDCAQSLTPAPVGDVGVEEMRKLAGSDLILAGGVPGAFFSPIYPKKALEDIVMRCLRHYKNDGKFILCVCDQVPPDAEIERVNLVSNLVGKGG